MVSEVINVIDRRAPFNPVQSVVKSSRCHSSSTVAAADLTACRERYR